MPAAFKATAGACFVRACLAFLPLSRGREPTVESASDEERWHFLRTATRIILALFFGYLGWLHLVRPEPFLQIMPPYLPWHSELVYLSGVCEILGGLGLVIPRVSRLAAWGLVALLVAVFPANVYMATNGIQVDGFPPERWMAWARLPFQGVFIALCLWCTRPPKTSRPGSAA